MRKTDIKLLDICVALVLLTRLPMPHLPTQTFSRQAQAVWAFPLVGFAVALPACCIATLMLWSNLPAAVVAGIYIACQILLSGAMHEDGLADSVDGLWGGMTRKRRLEIMKDSQIGSYGVLALILVIGLRWVVVSTLLAQGHIWPLLAIAALSRATMPVLMLTLPNARGSGLSQQVGRPKKHVVFLGCSLAMIITAVLCGPNIWVMLLGTSLMTFIIAKIAQAKIGGQTGDILGASQQLNELVAATILLASIS